MAMTETRPEAAPEPAAAAHDTAASEPVPTGGLVGLLGTGRHATIGRLWIGTSLVFLAMSGVLGALLGAERLQPETYNILSQDNYAQTLSLHGVGRAVPVRACRSSSGSPSIVVPRQVGAETIAFPRAAAAVVLGVPRRGRPRRGELPDQRRPVRRQRQGRRPVPRVAGDGRRRARPRIGLPRDHGARTAHDRDVARPGARCSHGRCSSPPPSGSPAWACCSVCSCCSTSTTATGCSRSARAPTIDQWLRWTMTPPQIFAYAIPVLGFAGDVVPVFSRTRARRYGFALGVIGAFGALSFGAWTYLGGIDNPRLSQQFLFVAASFVIVAPRPALPRVRRRHPRARTTQARQPAPVRGGVSADAARRRRRPERSAPCTRSPCVGTTADASIAHYSLGAVAIAALGAIHYWWPQVLTRPLKSGARDA